MCFPPSPSRNIRPFFPKETEAERSLNTAGRSSERVGRCGGRPRAGGFAGTRPARPEPMAGESPQGRAPPTTRPRGRGPSRGGATAEGGAGRQHAKPGALGSGAPGELRGRPASAPQVPRSAQRALAADRRSSRSAQEPSGEGWERERSAGEDRRGSSELLPTDLPAAEPRGATTRRRPRWPDCAKPPGHRPSPALEHWLRRVSAPGNTLGRRGPQPPAPSPAGHPRRSDACPSPCSAQGAPFSQDLCFPLGFGPHPLPALSQVSAVFLRTFQLVDYPHPRRLRTLFPSRARRVEGPVEDELASSWSGPGSLMAKGGGVSRRGGVRF